MARILYPVLTEPVLTSAQQPEQVTESRWHRPLSEPTRLRALPAAVLAAGMFWGAFTPAPAAAGWAAPLSQPVLRKGPSAALVASSGAVFGRAALFAETVTADRWVQPLSTPTRRRALPTSEQPSGAFVGSPAPSEATTLDRWHAPLATPVLRRALPTPEQPSGAFVKASPFAEAASVDKWQQPLPLPRAPKRAAEYPALSYSYYVAPSTEVVTLDKWLQPLAAPVRRLAGYPASYLASDVPPAATLPAATSGVEAYVAGSRRRLAVVGSMSMLAVVGSRKRLGVTGKVS